jgi:ubiquinone/menaquinone biosynthesis C-methylase UbiE
MGDGAGLNHDDHVWLLRDGVRPGGVWADLGSGRGAFTLALADLLGPEAQIHSLDRDAAALRDQAEALRARFPTARVQYHRADFTQPLALPPLDGVVIANALHFLPDPAPVLRALHALLVPGGRVVLVEYESEHGTPWVPYPISFRRWGEIAPACGFADVRRLRERPGRFMGGIYSALAVKL